MMASSRISQLQAVLEEFYYTEIMTRRQMPAVTRYFRSSS